jgi:histidine triad (HIT) family protein
VTENLDPEQVCIFCQIVAGAIPAQLLGASASSIAIADINPQAKVHALVIPRSHYANVAELAAADPGQLADLVELAQQVAATATATAIADTGATPGNETAGDFRLIFNSGATAGQSVFHVHGHVIAGQKLGWNPA